MACNPLFSCTLTRSSYKKPSKAPSFSTRFLKSNPVQFNHNPREISLPSVASIPYQPINVDYLEEEFSGHGVTFQGIGEYCVAKMKLQNGSTATVMLPSGLITSYKGKMWHGGTMELLQTNVVSKGDKNADAVIEGGVSLDVKIGIDGELTPWFPRTWALRDVRGNSKESIQVEMISSDSEGMIELRYLVNLEKDTLTSELTVSNSKPSPLQLTGSVISHLTVSSPEATYITGLVGSDFRTMSPFTSNFTINLPEKYQPLGSRLGKILSNTPFKDLGQKDEKNGDTEEELEGEEDDNYKQLADKMSMIYTSVPRYFTVLDRGRRNSVVVGREGLNELYVFSPGSTYEFYSQYAYICVAQSALLKPIIVGPGEVWRGGQKLHNPNLSY